ncbi:MAG: MlaA family lipoprotein, partial [Nitrosomonadaceae bacterium]
ATYMGFVTVGIAPAMGAVAAVDTRAGLLDTEEIVDEAALDKYEFLRDAYLQRRRSLVHDGNPPRSMDDELEGPDETDQDLASSTEKKEKKRSIAIEYIDPEDSENLGTSTD